MQTQYKPQHPQSRFIFDAKNMVHVWGKLPTKPTQLWKGEDLNGKKLEMAGNGPVMYWGWSS